MTHSESLAGPAGRGGAAWLGGELAPRPACVPRWVLEQRTPPWPLGLGLRAQSRCSLSFKFSILIPYASGQPVTVTVTWRWLTWPSGTVPVTVHPDSGISKVGSAYICTICRIWTVQYSAYWFQRLHIILHITAYSFAYYGAYYIAYYFAYFDILICIYMHQYAK